MKKCLIVYASGTGNTEKIAFALERNFIRHHWYCDVKKITKNYDVNNPDFEFEDYDFVCVGSPVIWRLPKEEIVHLMRFRERPHGRRIVPGPKSGLVFCSYAGIHLGPKEAIATLAMLEIELEHLAFNVVDRLAIPGRYIDKETKKWFHGDMRNMPTEKDLAGVSTIVDRIMEQI